MYVWRGKNRRDKRNLLLLGETFWGAEKGAKNLEHEDNVLRLERENEHVEYYARKVKALMTQYLATPNGLKEIDLLLAEQDKTSDGAVLMLLTGDEEKDERIRANVFNVYQGFCVPESTFIDKTGLKNLFSDLQLTMSQRQFQKYLVKLNIQKTNKAVDFDSFFDGTVHIEQCYIY